MGPTSLSAEELDGGAGGDEAGAIAGGVVAAFAVVVGAVAGVVGGVVVGFASGFCGGSVETCDESCDEFCVDSCDEFCVDSCVEALLAVRGVSAGPSQAAVMQIVATAHERIMHCPVLLCIFSILCSLSFNFSNSNPIISALTH